MLQLQEADNLKKRKNRLPQPGQRFFTQGGRKQRISRYVDQLKRGTRGQEKTSQASDHVFISMWEVATDDWSSCESGVRTLQKGEKHEPENDRRHPNRNSGAHSKCRL
jgi:hypothetical protein